MFPVVGYGLLRGACHRAALQIGSGSDAVLRTTMPGHDGKASLRGARRSNPCFLWLAMDCFAEPVIGRRFRSEAEATPSFGRLCPAMTEKRHCEERDEAIHVSCGWLWIASRSLSSGGASDRKRKRRRPSDDYARP